MIGGLARGLAKMLAWDAVTIFDNVTQVMDAIREAGYGYRNSEMRRDVRNIWEIVHKPEGGPESWTFDLYPRSNMPEVEWKSDKLFQVHGIALYEDAATGLTYERRVSLYSDHYMEGFEYLGELADQDAERERYSGQQIVSFTPSVMWHKRGAAFPSPFELSEL